MLEQINNYSGAIIAIATIILVTLTGRYVCLTNKLTKIPLTPKITAEIELRTIDRSDKKEDGGLSIKWTHCRGQNTVKISKIIENHRHSFSRNRPQPALHNRDSGEVVGHYRNGYNELIHRKELVPSGTVSDKHLHT